VYSASTCPGAGIACALNCDVAFVTAELLQNSEKRIRPAPLALRDQIENRLTLAVFLCTVLVFSLLTFRNFAIPAGTISQVENRKYSGFPHVKVAFDSLRDFPAGFEKFYADRFAMRQKTTELLGTLKYCLFQTTATPFVIVGSHNWLFFRGDGDEFAIRHWPLFSKMELRAWASMLEQRRNWLAKRNIKFLFVLVPTKSSVYPEFVPLAWEPLSNDSRAKQLCRYLKQFTKVGCLDLQEPLIQAKPMGKLYFKTDTHWDPLGAYVGYRAMTKMIRHVLPSFEPVELKDTVRVAMPSMHGDLLGIAGLGGFILDPYESCIPKVVSFKVSPRPGNLPPDKHLRVAFAMEQSNPALPAAYFIHDSFLINDIPLFSQSFRRVYYDWREGYPFRTKSIVEEQPDIVVQEMTERHLTEPLPANPPEILMTGTEVIGHGSAMALR